jgi:hypothetical protein
MRSPIAAEQSDIAAGWLQSPWVLALLCIAGVLPIALTGMPLLVDLGGHLGRFAVQTDGGASPILRQWYSFHWGLVPNLGTDLLVQVMSPWLGLEPALRLIVTAIPGLQIAGWLLLARAVHGRVPPTALFALPLAYGYPFQFGFINFTLGMALGTILLALWVWLERRDRQRLRWLLFVPLSCIVWITHLVGWAVFAIMAGSQEVAAWRPRGMNWVRVAAQAGLALSCLLAPWLISAMFGGPHGHGTTTQWFEIRDKLSYLIMPLRDRWAVWDVGSALVLLGVIGWCWGLRWMVFDQGLLLGVLVLAGLYSVMPGRLIGSAYADMRLMPAMLALALVAARPGPLASGRAVTALAVTGLVFAGARLGGNGASLALFDRAMRGDLAALDDVPVGSELVSLTTETCDPSLSPWQRERRFHLPGYAIARRRAFSNDQWVIPGGQLIQVHNPAAGAFATDPSEVAHDPACRHHPGLETVVARIPQTMTLLWVLDDGRARRFAGWHPVRFTPGSVLYRRD